MSDIQNLLKVELGLKALTLLIWLANFKRPIVYLAVDVNMFNSLTTKDDK